MADQIIYGNPEFRAAREAEYEAMLWANDAKKKIAELSELLREIADTKRHLYARSPEGRAYLDRIDAALQMISATHEEGGKQTLTVMVPRAAPSLSISTLSRLMTDCMPDQLEEEGDFDVLIGKLWPALVCEWEL